MTPILIQWVPAFYIALSGAVLLWLTSLVFRDASLVDRFWGLGFVGVGGYYFWQVDSPTYRNYLILVLVAIWGLRLSLYIYFRNRNKPEDVRYVAMRAKHPESFWWRSLIGVFLLQGFLVALLSAPIIVVQIFPQSGEWTLLDLVAVMVWGVGFYFEAVGDYQLSKFKRNPSNQGQVCSVGLWGRTRHPNYFGESLMWWAFFLIALGGKWGWATVFSPVLMTYLLLKVSGVALLERNLKKTKPKYLDYVQRVPAFFPKCTK